MSESKSSHETYRPFMIAASPSREMTSPVSIHQQQRQYSSCDHQHTPRKKPSRPLLPSAVLSHDDRATWWSTEEYPKADTVSSCSSHGHEIQTHTHSSISLQPAWNDEYEEALQSENGSICAAREGHHQHHHQRFDSIAYSDQSHNTSTHLLHHYDTDTKNERNEDLKDLWEVASSLLTRPASMYSCTVDMSNASLPHEPTKEEPQRRQRILFPWSRLGRPTAAASSAPIAPPPTPATPHHTDNAEKELDPESIAEGIVECTDLGRRASTATALTWRAMLPSPRHHPESGSKRSDMLPKSSSAAKSFSDSEQVREPKTRCRWWVVILCLLILAVGVACIVLGCLLSQNGGDWSRLVG